MFTKLQIINGMLSAVGDDPISDPDSMYPSAIKARDTLERIDIEMQTSGWWFNKDYQVTLAASVSGEVTLPQNVLAVDLPNDLSTKYVQRGTRMYDKLAHSYTIGQSLVVNMISRLVLTELPSIALVYLNAKCIEQFYVDDDGDTDKASRYLRNANIAWTNLVREDLKQKRINANMRPSVQAIMGGIRPASQSVGYNNPVYPGGKPL